jgi:hypothetical protein
MAIKSEVFPYGWLRGFDSGLVVRARAACCHFSMNYTRAGDLGKARSGYPRCRNTLRSILNLSSLAITPTDLYRKRLSRLRKDSAIKITAMPVFSNVGEPSCVAPHGHVAPLLLSSALLGCRVVFLAFIVHKPNASSQR